MSIEIVETKRMVNNWEEYTGKFVAVVALPGDAAHFALPGRGGPVTKRAADKLGELFAAGKSVGEVAKLTGLRWE